MYRKMGDLREQMVDNVGVDDAVEEVAADEAKVAVNRGQGALDEGPAVGLEVVDLRVSVVQVGDGNYNGALLAICRRIPEKGGEGDIPSQWWTQKYGTPYIRNTIFQPTTVEAR